MEFRPDRTGRSGEALTARDHSGAYSVRRVGNSEVHAAAE